MPERAEEYASGIQLPEIFGTRYIRHIRYNCPKAPVLSGLWAVPYFVSKRGTGVAKTEHGIPDACPIGWSWIFWAALNLSVALGLSGRGFGTLEGR
jgi:hypothetical protein